MTECQLALYCTIQYVVHNAATMLCVPFHDIAYKPRSWWCHQTETYSALLFFSAGTSSLIGEFPSQKPVTWSFDVFFDLGLNNWGSKQSRCWWFEMPSPSLWCHYYGWDISKSTIFFYFYMLIFPSNDEARITLSYIANEYCWWPGIIAKLLWN